MQIPTPPMYADAIVLADWLELLAITRENGTSSEADIRGLLSGPEGDPALYDGDESVQDEEVELRVQEVFDELDDRTLWAGRGYPFEIRGMNVVRLRAGPKYVSIAYLLSLLISFLKRFKDEEVKKSNFPQPDEIEDLFQICGTVAAAGYVDGAGVSFGFPRLDSKPFYEKLQLVSDSMGEGKPKLGWDLGASPDPKDAGVDVIAWRECPDRLPGQVYLLGQCATGKRWQSEKHPVKDYGNFHEYYWANGPHSPLLSAVFIPFDFRESVTQGKYEDLEEAYRWERWKVTKDFGVILDRFRLAHYFSRGLGRTICTTSKVEGRRELRAVRTWVTSAIQFLRQEQSSDAK